jgi:hypothetical protein
MTVLDWLTYGASVLLFGLILVTFDAVVFIIKQIKEERKNGK